jgi:hypothetical protein
MINANCQHCEGKALADEDQRHDYQQNATNGKVIRSCEIRTLINSQLQNAIFCHT